ncbi:MAG: ABC transporter ATP-binding protein [Gaiellales bacterium]|nr:ABC transporter ATP-binding protein [Gaiellales bacterium]
MSALLSLKGVRAGYGSIEVLHGLDLGVQAGEIVSIIGVNGSGKSTLLQAVSGVVPLRGGCIELEGERLDTTGVEGIVRRGVVQIPEGRQLFGPLTVEENLELGGYSRRGRRGRHAGGDGRARVGSGPAGAAARLDQVYALFPRLAERRRQAAATLSGGEQQMLALGRALMAEPRLLLLDEPSMGLAPLIVRDIFRVLRELNQQGLTLLLVEQDARTALNLAHRGLVMERGRIVLEDRAEVLLASPDVQSIYFGQGGGRHGRGTRPAGQGGGSA